MYCRGLPSGSVASAVHVMTAPASCGLEGLGVRLPMTGGWFSGAVSTGAAAAGGSDAWPDVCPVVCAILSWGVGRRHKILPLPSLLEPRFESAQAAQAAPVRLSDTTLLPDRQSFRHRHACRPEPRLQPGCRPTLAADVSHSRYYHWTMWRPAAILRPSKCPFSRNM